MGEDSVSFLPYLPDAKKAPFARPAIIHDKQTIRDGDWKLILPKPKKNKSAPAAELYNLRNDLAEEHNLISQHPEVAKRLRDALQSLLAD